MVEAANLSVSELCAWYGESQALHGMDFEVKRGEMIAGGIVCSVLAAALLTVVLGAHWPTTEASVQGSTVAGFGHALMSTYLVPFEAVSVLLLVVMIGAALLARQE